MLLQQKFSLKDELIVHISRTFMDYSGWFEESISGFSNFVEDC